MFSQLKNMVSGNRPKVSRAQMLGAIPVRNGTVEWARETRDESHPNVALLRIPRRSDKFGNTVAKLFRLPEHRRLELDEIGSDVWEMCDGTISVDALTRAICTKYHLNRRQAEASVTAYLKMLAERRLVALKAAKGSGTKPPVKSAAKAATAALPGDENRHECSIHGWGGVREARVHAAAG